LPAALAASSIHLPSIEIADAEARIWVFAEQDGIEERAEFTFPARGKKAPDQ